MNKYVVIVAGGSGKRMNSGIPKQFLELCGKPMLMYTISKFYAYDNFIKIILALPENQIEYWKGLCSKHKFSIKHSIVPGGKERFHSVKNALIKIKDTGIVAVHDGVRPLVSVDTIKRCFNASSKLGNAIPAVDISESVRVMEKSRNKAVDRSKYKLIQTPQVFKTDIIKKAYTQDYKPQFTDDASVVEALGYKINLVEGNFENIKITSPLDLIMAEALMKH
ncbi:MAG: 2-C-methyl-D-erythritol 4-phosphate cytidylyltransferase [Bacteroidia bacterium]|nr:2-C-methyl-D-erythritol 4-phosphate cytidylyltransferase [Bacteroidia bacterium]